VGQTSPFPLFKIRPEGDSAPEPDPFFQYKRFWHFSPEFNTSNANPQIEFGSQGYFHANFHRQFPS
jgi:hypothetical protein